MSSRPSKQPKALIRDVSTGLADGLFILVSVTCGFLSYQVYLQSSVVF